MNFLKRAFFRLTVREGRRPSSILRVLKINQMYDQVFHPLLNFFANTRV